MARVPSSDTSTRAALAKLNQALLQLTRRVVALERAQQEDDTIIPLGFDAPATFVYLPIRGTSTSATATDAAVNWIAPWDCEVVEVVLLNITTSYDETVVTTHTDSGSAVVDTATADLVTGVGPVVFPLGTAVEAGQRLRIGFDATSDGGPVTGYIRIRRLP